MMKAMKRMEAVDRQWFASMDIPIILPSQLVTNSVATLLLTDLPYHFHRLIILEPSFAHPVSIKGQTSDQMPSLTEHEEIVNVPENVTSASETKLSFHDLWFSTASTPKEYASIFDLV
jgi:hypothetical protein